MTAASDTPAPRSPPPESERALVVPPTRRDGEVTLQLLADAGIDAVVCVDGMAALAREVDAGIGVLIVTDAALGRPDFDVVRTAIDRQPPWSDIPVVLLTGPQRRPAAAIDAVAALTNVTVLDLPVSKLALLSAVQAALRARRRQYQIRDHLEKQRAAEAALREADRRKDHFLATLAHELRNPLAPIRSGLQTLRLIEGERDDAAGVRGMMERQVEQLVKLTDELLDVSRIVTGKVMLTRERVDLRDVIDGAIEGAQPLLDLGDHRLNRHAPPAPLWVMADPSRLTQAVGNLITNAAKYSPDASDVTVTLARDGPDAVIDVVDRGAGIPPEMLEPIFDMFTQVERTLHRSQGGLGIGLSLVRQLIEQHGGSVHAESAGVDRGSRFVIRLPLLDSASADPSLAPAADVPARPRFAAEPATAPAAQPTSSSAPATQPTSTAPPPPAARAAPSSATDAAPPPATNAAAAAPSAQERPQPADVARPLKVLVVDDNVDAADSLALLLEAEGHQTRTEYSGPAALTAAADFLPDAVLCDLGMPGMDGHAVARSLRADARQASTLLIALTGWGNEDDKRRTREAGFDAHLVKPVTLDTLRHVLERF